MMKFKPIIILGIVLLLSGCVSPIKQLIIQPVPDATQNSPATSQFSELESTIEPTSSCMLIDSQEIKDLVDAANGTLLPSLGINRLEAAIRENMPGVQHTSVYLTLGTLYETLDDTEKAIDSYTKAIDLCDINAVAYLFRGELYYKQTDYENASQDFHSALEVKPPWSLIAYYENEANYYLKEIEDHQQISFIR
ncbi:MAG TPA: tetratricopeptide repeat protein [Bellilinea sp.]|nr:tetratricopeptide repeat protein [Bellilinea sp.]